MRVTLYSNKYYRLCSLSGKHLKKPRPGLLGKIHSFIHDTPKTGIDRIKSAQNRNFSFENAKFSRHKNIICRISNMNPRENPRVRLI